MKTASTALRNLIEGGVFFRADLFTLTMIDGTVVRYTSADILMKWGGNSFPPMRIVRDKIKSSLGFSVDQTKVTIFPSSTDTLAGIAFGQAVRLGMLDGTLLLCEKAYLDSWGNPDLPGSANIVGVLHGFQGQLSDLDASNAGIQLAIKSALELLNIDMPRNVYQSTCLHVVYDAGCTLSRAAFTVTGSVTGSPSLNGLASGLAQPDGYFELGVLAFTSGPCNGSRRTVKTFAGGAFTFAFPLPALPVVGNTFAVYPGCDRRQVTCGGKFSNIAHFKAYPYIPVPETSF